MSLIISFPKIFPVASVFKKFLLVDYNKPHLFTAAANVKCTDPEQNKSPISNRLIHERNYVT